ncbi:class I SAM-dependent methyltransferase [Marinobacter sp. ANT_B65]|uniref:class I SAM-dependent methyltransferase n=1 Tax=Marinobacter sp. ANT_B65 TaxID=2039467 RepID=UPI000BBF15D4|nr:class I SAM-dependent methyltransferase [Marinobacter sp. ANT_B65]PCM44199.1 hypothetical protein CPA50_11845 [Marinobacter sp. ANT_B65]
MSQSVAYYNEHAQAFLDETLYVDMSALYDSFLPHLPENAHILDAGCGSGRDSREFLARGYRVTAFDASDKLAGLASRAISHPVSVRTFDQVSEYQTYDGIWASALHKVGKTAIWQTADRRPGRDEYWLNGVFQKCDNTRE